MLKKFALAGAMVGAVALVALAATPLHTYNNSVGQEQETIGVQCINNTTGEPESCGSSSSSSITSPLGAGTSAGAVRTTQGSDSPLVTQMGAVTETAPTTDTGSSGLNGRLQRVAQRITSHLGIAQLASYVVTAAGYTAYTTPTDLMCISGSATKTVAVTQAYIAIQSTSAALQTVLFIKRSTANTGGTSTTPTPVSYDSSRGAATAVVTVYTAAPSLGNVVGNIRVILLSSGVATGSPGVISMSAQGIPSATRTTQQTPVILRGTAESLCINYAGAALTSGFTSSYGFEWVEFTSADD